MLQNTIVFATVINNNYSIIKLRFRFVRQLTHRQNDNNFNLFIDRSLYVEHKIIAMLGYIGDGSASRVHWQKYHSTRIPISVFLFRFKRAYVIVSMRYEGKQETEENKKKKREVTNEQQGVMARRSKKKEKEERLATSQSLEGAVEAALPGRKEKKYGTEINAAPSNLDPSSLRINGNERNGSRKSFFFFFLSTMLATFARQCCTLLNVCTRKNNFFYCLFMRTSKCVACSVNEQFGHYATNCALGIVSWVCTMYMTLQTDTNFLLNVKD